MKKLKQTRAELLKREIIDILKEHTSESERIEVVQKRHDQEKQECDEQIQQVEELTQFRDRDKQVLSDLNEQLKNAKESYRTYGIAYTEQRSKAEVEENDRRKAFDIASSESICQANNKVFAEFFEFEMQCPTKKCQEIVYLLYVMLRGEESEETLNYSWDKACEMMSRSKKLIEECS